MRSPPELQLELDQAVREVRRMALAPMPAAWRARARRRHEIVRLCVRGAAIARRLMREAEVQR